MATGHRPEKEVSVSTGMLIAATEILQSRVWSHQLLTIQGAVTLFPSSQESQGLTLAQHHHPGISIHCPPECDLFQCLTHPLHSHKGPGISPQGTNQERYLGVKYNSFLKS
jgi:hypothetical protein